MKKKEIFVRRLLSLGRILLAAGFFPPLSARAGLTMRLNIQHGYGLYYSCSVALATNTTAPNAPLGGYVISSPTNAWSFGYQLTSAGLSFPTYLKYSAYTDFDAFQMQLTNGNWTVVVTNATSTNLYNFKVTTTGFTSNSLPNVIVTFPVNGSVNVTNRPTFTWQGPASWSGSLFVADYNPPVYTFSVSAFPPTSQTSWTFASALPDGANEFYVNYNENASASIVASPPVDNAAQPIAGWVSTASLDAYAYSDFSVTNPPPSSGGSVGHTNVAYYSFEDANLIAHDFSGRGNNMASYGYIGGATNAPHLTNAAVAGSYAVAFSGFGFQLPPTNLVATLASSFSVSLWARTSLSHGNDADAASSGAGLLSANYDQVIPMALTGSKLAFQTGTADTLHSAASINSGSYVHLTVTRDQGSGQKKIYVNGALDASASGVAGLLTSASAPSLYLGMNSTYSAGLSGDIDEVQIYSGVLSDGEVLQLYNNPGTRIADATGGAPDLGTALNATNLTWITSGSSSWFGQTTNTHDGVAAAQSGIVTNSQISTLQTTVTGPGTLTFWWSTQTPPDDHDFYLEFDIDGAYWDDISNLQPWIQQNSISIPAGSHTLTWIAHAGAYPASAGWVDQVSFTPEVASVAVNFSLQIERYRNLTPLGYSAYLAFPNITFSDPPPVTTNRVESANGVMHAEVLPGNLSSLSSFGESSSSLDQLIHACTNGQWTLYINKGDPSQRIFHFNISIAGLTTNLLADVNFLVPSNNAVNVATNSPIQWSGPANFPAVQVYSYPYPSSSSVIITNLPGSATNWPSPPILPYGTNTLIIYYTSNRFPNASFTTPVDAGLNPISSWIPQVDLISLGQIFYVVGAPAPLPVQLISSLPQTSGGNFQLSFQTLAGRPQTIQVSTNLTGAWTDVTNFIGDGSVRQFTFPTTNSTGNYFRVKTQ